MRIVVAPDKYAGTLTATEAAEAIRDGWRLVAPDDELELVPLSDGGPGFLEVLHAGLGGTVHAATVTGPLGDPTPAPVLRVGDSAYVEAAQACGLHLVDGDRRDALRASSYGVGELMSAALEAGVRRLVVGVGGTASTDGGAGLLAALGATPGDDLSQGGGALADLVAEVDLTKARERLVGVELVAATDVDAPLLGSEGAAHGFGAQKGADRAARDRLETGLRVWATATDGGIAVRGGAGAGGGIGFALMLLGASREPGAQLALDAVRLDERARAADLLVTGEGAFDWQSLRGKVVAGVARTGQQTGRPTVVLAGRVDVGRRELSNAGIDAAYAIVDMPAGDRGHTAAEDLRALASRVARTWSH
ncbi:MAG: glycerate kinase family protein [Actinomycetes bacterium]